MSLTTKTEQYFKSFISPYRYHEQINDHSLTVADSVLISWLFAIVNGIFRIILINIVLLTLSSYAMGPEATANLLNKDANIGYYLLILSSVLDIIFFPLFTLFIVQFWTFLIGVFARFLKVEGDVDLKVERVVTSSLSSNIFMAVPIFGGFLQKFSSLVLLFIGMKEQLKFTTSVSTCVLLTPVFIVMVFIMILGMMSLKF